MGSQIVDCVLIGHYDLDFEQSIATAKPTAQYSAFYEYLKHNSVLVENRRFTYMQFLNRILTKLNGVDPGLHLARLPNLASCYLYSFLRHRGFHVEIVNFMNRERDRLIDLLKAGPRAVALSTTLYLDPRPVTEIVQFIRKWNSDTKIIVGGPFISKACRVNDIPTVDFLFRSMGADVYVYDSEGELTLSRILSELRSSAPDLSSISNLVIRSGDRFSRTAPSPEDNDLDANSIDWSLLDSEFLGQTVQTRTARSCAFKCTFCSHPELAGELRLASVETVERELRRIQEKGAQNVLFIDDTFNVPLNRFKAICRMIIRNGFQFKWYSYFRCSNADDETFNLMEDSGCAGVFLGVESGDDQILRSMDKFASIDRLRSGISELNKRGIVTFASFIIGFPGETDASVENTLTFIRDTQPRFFRAELWYADPLTAVMARAKEFDIRGGALSWSHRTMDWKRGSEWVRHIYSSVKNSRILPVYDFDFWSIPYLTGQGLSLSQIDSFTSITAKLMVKSLDDSHFDSGPEEAELIGALSNSRLHSGAHGHR